LRALTCHFLINADRIGPAMTAKDVQAILGPPDPDNVVSAEAGYRVARWTGMDGQIKVSFTSWWTPNYSSIPLPAQARVAHASWTSRAHEPLGKRLQWRWDTWMDQIDSAIDGEVHPRELMPREENLG
jgi:hypothetical protein